MKQTFKLKKGEILFDNDKITTKDDAKKQRWMVSLMVPLPAIYAILTFLKSLKNANKFD